MSIRTIAQPLPGERVVGLSPQDAGEAASTWLRRPNLFPGRALSAAALAHRQAWQAGRITQRAQGWSPGIVDGLELQTSLEEGTGFASVVLQVGKGRGLSVAGEDVVLTRPLECRLADVPVVAPPGFFDDGSDVGPGDVAAEVAEPYPRIVAEPPAPDFSDVVTLGDLDGARLAALPSVGVLLLQPVQVATANLDAFDPCERSACSEGTVDDAAAFEDWRNADALRLLWYVWPGEHLALPDVPAPQLRNALAWKIFDAERRLAPSAALPWEPWGVPLALVVLGADRRPVWVDRASVVRSGGRPRDPRLQIGGSAVATGSRLPALWQAQIEQFAEQIAAAGEPAPPAGDLADAFTTRLPPVGLLPKNAYEPATYRSPFFPSGFDLDAAPIPVEQLDLAVRASAGLAPLDPHTIESVRLLVPVPLQSWEPRLLLRDTVAREFFDTLERFLLVRARTLGLRQGLRQKAAMLSHAMNGQIAAVASYKDDPLAVEVESLGPWGEPPPGGGHRSAPMSGVHQHFFTGATPPFVIAAAGESLFAWVYLDPANPPRTLMLQWHLKDGSEWGHRAYWGEDLIAFGSGDTTPGHWLAGPLPPIGQWVMVTVAADRVGLAGNSVDGMAFTLFDGRAAYGLTGARTAAAERKWFCNVLPPGAGIQGNEAWTMLSQNDLWAPFEAGFGVVPSLPPPALPDAAPPAADDPLRTPTSGFNVQYRPAIGWRGHEFSLEDGNPGPLRLMLSAGEPIPGKLLCSLYLDELTPPRSIFVSLSTSVFGDEMAYDDLNAFWGEDHVAELAQAMPSLRIGQRPPVRAGALPASSRWVQLEIPLPPRDQQELLAIYEFRFFAYGGELAVSDITFARPTDAGGTTGWALTVSEPVWPRRRSDGTIRTPLRKMLEGVVSLRHNLGVLTPTPSALIGTVQAYADLMRDPVLTRLSSHEQSQLLLRGLGGFTDFLRARIDRADDITDFGFAHMQVDLHRVRQLMMNTSDAGRLAVSPALASIARGDSALVVQGQIKDYLATVKKTAPPGAAPTPAPATGPTTGFAGMRAIAAAATTAPALQAVQAGLSARLISAPKAPATIVFARPIVGASELRTAAIADRLTAPPSTESRDHALANRQRTVASLLDLLRAFQAEDSGETPALLAGFQVIGLAGDPFLAGTTGGRRPLADFVANPALLGALLQPPPLTVPWADEALYFTQAVSLSDTTIAMLRQLEGRLTIYRDVLARCEATLTELEGQNTAAARRLQSVADELAEARHDVGVARALLAEEDERVAAVNARRAKVLAEEVKFLAYVRPREADNLLATPIHAVDPGLIDPPVPACLREHPDLPEDLLDMLRVVRDAPANWFVRLPALLGKLDKVEHLVRLVQGAQWRAAAGLGAPVALQAAAVGKLGTSIARVNARQVEALAPRVAAVQALSVAALANTSWQGVRTQAEQVVSFADLAEGGHGRPEVARAAAAELENIRSIVACLHAEFSGVSASIRLDWAETLSEFDGAPELRDLSRLPRWAEIGYVDRRQMQAYVDFLFAQIEPGQSQAVALVNDVVRMCLLLASHAPVDRIVTGRLARPVTGVAPGLRIPLAAVDRSRLRVGMQAVLYRGSSVVARATVEDLGLLEVAARVIHTATAKVDLGDDVRVHFDDAAMVSLKTADSARTRFGR